MPGAIQGPLSLKMAAPRQGYFMEPRRSQRGLSSLAAVPAAMLLIAAANPIAASQPVRVIHVSVDGLRPDAITSLGPAHLPNFYRLRMEGAVTDNARTDYAYTVTLPNHATQLTGRRVNGAGGHNWVANSDPAPGATLHNNKGSYVASVWDVAHDHGLRTACYASKSKFVLFEQSYNETNGAADVTGSDNGRDKIDVYVNDEDTAALVARFIEDHIADPFHYAFIHLRDTDDAGHADGWDVTPGSAYSFAVRDMDARLGELLDMIDQNSSFATSTYVILTTDHGGTDFGHDDEADSDNYTIPFYVWGPGVACGADLYALNPLTRGDPGGTRPTYGATPQPVRNGEAANLALSLLGLPPVPLSQINVPNSLDTARTLTPGDTNCDGTINPFDVQPFIDALMDPGGYAGTNPCCGIGSADVNGDGTLNPFDIQSFIELLS